MEKRINDSSPLVSVIIPVYNGEAYLAACLQSVLNQTYSHLEVIIVNDGSSDGTSTIMEHYQSLDARITSLHKPNQGPSLAREEGIKVSQGKYIQFLDSDDELLSDAIERLINRAETANADMVVAPFYFCSAPELKTLSMSLAFDELSGINYLREILTGRTYWSVWSHFLKRSLLCNQTLETVPNIAFGEDAIMMVQIALRAQKVVSMDTATLNYNIRSSSLSHPQNFNDKKYNEFKIYTAWIENYINESELAKEMTKEMALFCTRNTFSCIYWRRDENLDEKMGKVVSDLRRFPELKKIISKRERKIVSFYKVSKKGGYLYVLYCRRRNKI